MTPAALSATPCLVCSGPSRRFAVIRGFLLRQCEQCDLVFRRVQALPPAELAGLFGKTYFAGTETDGYVDYLATEAALRRQARRYLSLLERARGGKGTLFDVGCAVGFLLDEARQRGWQVAGCDPSPWASRYARERLGLPIRIGAFDDEATDDARAAERDLSAVTFLNVLEHCANPARAVARAERALVSGGVVLVETWDRDSVAARLSGRRWHQWSPRRVQSWFNRSSLEALFPHRTWEWLRFGPVVRWLPLARGLEVVGAPPIGALGRILLPYRLGDLVALHVRKR